ncbi:MAG TPA: YciI family protein [Bryobacteraceae bacterium]|nr:YciI family protein [Bryobacteraceae bacterium]
MRFMMIYKPADVTKLEDGVPPTQKGMAEMGAFIAEVAQSGALLAADGLMASSTGAKVKLKDGKVTVTDGPFTEAKELIGGFAIVQYPSKKEAIAMAERFLKLAGDGESEIRQMHDVQAFPPPKK